MFHPTRIIFEPDALNYDLGRKLYEYFGGLGAAISFTASHNRVTGIPGKTAQEGYREAKRTLVVGVRKNLDFQPCKPSADYQLPLATSCPGKCEYCYLATTLGKKPYIRVYVNINDILGQALTYINQRKPEATVFEGAATSDPLPLEPFTGQLRSAIAFFGEQEYGRFRFVTKFTEVDSLLDVDHQRHTVFRFSINTEQVIRRFEHGTPGLSQRLGAAAKVAGAGYPVGLLVAPIILEPNWQDEYSRLLEVVARELPLPDLSFELITHRFTPTAKKRILEILPETQLPMVEADRTYKYGQFGYGKYVYPQNAMEEVRNYFDHQIHHLFINPKVLYLV